MLSREIARSASRYSSGLRSPESASSEPIRTTETGVFSSCAASAMKPFVRLMESSIRSRRRLNVAASRPSSSPAFRTSSRRTFVVDDVGRHSAGLRRHFVDRTESSCRQPVAPQESQEETRDAVLQQGASNRPEGLLDQGRIALHEQEHRDHHSGRLKHADDRPPPAPELDRSRLAGARHRLPDLARQRRRIAARSGTGESGKHGLAPESLADLGVEAVEAKLVQRLLRGAPQRVRRRDPGSSRSAADSRSPPGSRPPALPGEFRDCSEGPSSKDCHARAR